MSAVSERGSRAGFTMIELMVSMSIFAVITGFVVVNYRAGQRSDELRLAADTAVSVMRDTLFKAVGGTQADVCVAGTGEKSIRPSGGQCPGGTTYVPQVPLAWGFAFGSSDASHVLLFADLDGNGFPSDTEVVSSVAYSQSGLVVADSGSPAIVTVVMEIPSYGIKVDGAAPTGEVALALVHGGSGERKDVVFNPWTRRVDVVNP